MDWYLNPKKIIKKMRPQRNTKGATAAAQRAADLGKFSSRMTKVGILTCVSLSGFYHYSLYSSARKEIERADKILEKKPIVPGQKRRVSLRFGFDCDQLF